MQSIMDVLWHLVHGTNCLINISSSMVLIIGPHSLFHKKHPTKNQNVAYIEYSRCFYSIAKETLFVEIPLSERIGITVYIPYSHVLSSCRGYSG